MMQELGEFEGCFQLKAKLATWARITKVRRICMELKSILQDRSQK